MLSTKLECILSAASARTREILNLVRSSSGSKIALRDNPNSVMRYSTKQVQKPEPEEVDGQEKVRRKGSMHGASSVLQYMQSENLQDIVERMPENLVKRMRNSPKQLYLVNRRVAKELVEMFMQDRSTNNLYTLEGNPGLGILTEELLAAGVPAVQLFEPEEHFHGALTALREKYPQRLDLKTADLFQIWKLLFQDRIDNGHRFETLLADVPNKNWEEEPSVRVVGAVPSVYFLKHMIMSTVFQSSLMATGRPVLYLVMEPPIWIHLTCNPASGYLLYRANTVLFQLLFHYKLIGKVPRRAFLPWQNNYVAMSQSKLTKVKQTDPDLMYVTRIEPKASLFTDLVSREHLVPLWYFIKHHMVSRNNRVIPHLERWIPGCGPRLIAKGFNIFTQFGDLSPQEIFTLYKDFSSWPNFNESTFLSSMESVLSKMYDLTEALENDAHDSEEETEEKDQSKIDSEGRARIGKDSRAENEDESHEDIEDESHEEIEDESHEEIDDESHEEIDDESHEELLDEFHEEVEDEVSAELDNVKVEFGKELNKSKSGR